MQEIISVYEYKKLDISNALVMTGFPTVGLVGTIAPRFIINTLKLDLIGAFSSDFFQPITVVSGAGLFRLSEYTAAGKNAA